jgi:ribosomal protein S20
MKLFFKAEKYITRVESPRVSSDRSRKSQVLLYIDKYFDMYNHEYLGSVYTACKEYIEEMMDDEDSATASISTEVQACTTIIKGLQDFIGQGKHEEMRYMKLLAAKEAFKFYCAMISKVLEMDLIDKKQAKRRITKFYNECGLE